MGQERRKYVRVSTDCVVAYRVKNGGEEGEKLIVDRFDPISSNEISEIVSKIRSSGSESDKMTMELLLWIDWKVNYLIKTLLKEKEAAIFPYEADMVDLSANGVKFNTHKYLEIGTGLQMRFFLPILPFNEMVLDAVVCRSGEIADKADAPPKFEIGIEFTEVKESDREAIFRYVIKRERQLRQAQREQGYEVKL